MMFWKRKETRVLKEVLEMLEVVRSKLVVHEKEIDMIKAKLKSKLYRDSAGEIEGSDAPQDDFDEVRKIGKDIKTKTLGL